MALTKVKLKKKPKKTHPLFVSKGLKKIKTEELRRKLAKSKSPVFIILDNEKFEIPENERRQFLENLIEAVDLKAAQKDGNILSTQEVADLLNVSRPYVIKLIESHQLKSFKVGAHRRIFELDAIEYRKKMRNEQTEALDQLAEETENLGIEFK